MIPGQSLGLEKIRKEESSGSPRAAAHILLRRLFCRFAGILRDHKRVYTSIFIICKASTVSACHL